MVAAVALGMKAVMLQRILLCLSPAISQSVQRVYELALLHEEIETRCSAPPVAIWRASHPARKPVLTARSPAATLAARERASRQRPAGGPRSAGTNTPGPAALRARKSCIPTGPVFAARTVKQKSRHHRIEKTPPGAVFDLDNPDVGIELDLPREIGLGVGLGRVALLRHRMNARSAGRASSNADCGAGPYTSALPSRREILMLRREQMYAPSAIARPPARDFASAPTVTAC